MISIIAAIDKNNALGFKNQLLFYLPADLKHFKSLTTGNTIIMGRKTFDSLPKGALPNRRNIVLSRNTKLTLPGAEVYKSLDEALKHCSDEEKIYIIGGASVYKQAMEIAQELCMTLVDAEAPQADVYFPTIDPDIWEEKSREPHLADEKNPCNYSYVNYQRR